MLFFLSLVFTALSLIPFCGYCHVLKNIDIDIGDISEVLFRTELLYKYKMQSDTYFDTYFLLRNGNGNIFRCPVFAIYKIQNLPQIFTLKILEAIPTAS